MHDAPRTTEIDEIVNEIKRLKSTMPKLPSERALAEMLDVKRHQLRKALDELRKAGTLPAPPRRLAAVSTEPLYNEELVRMTNPLEVLEVRFMMEPGLARLASLRASALEASQILAAATTPHSASSGTADFTFHVLIAQAAGNRLASEFYKTLRHIGVDARVRVAKTGTPSCPKAITQRDAEHRAIAEAISRRDPEAAEAAMRTHLMAVQQRIHQLSSAAVFAA